jgi:uncharacterized oligopeptide transporter (OPT) family protein
MDLSLYLQPVSITIEVIICGIALGIGILKKKVFGWLIALTFAIYVVYDISAFSGEGLSSSTSSVIFLIASISMLVAVWLLFSREPAPG